MAVKSGKVLIIIIVLGLVSAFVAFDLGQFLTLESIQEKYNLFFDFYSNNRFLTLFLFVSVYILITALSLPGAAVMTVAAGALFGLILGIVIVSFSSTVGATIAFLISRFIFRDSVQRQFGSRLEGMNHGLKNEGAFYLFSLRLVPAVPFFVINLVMGLTEIKTSVFIFTSQAGMLPGTVLFVYAGTQLAEIESLSGILTPGIVLSFGLLGIFPLLAKRIVRYIQNKRV